MHYYVRQEAYALLEAANAMLFSMLMRKFDKSEEIDVLLAQFI